jgi:hypothetical protein
MIEEEPVDLLKYPVPDKEMHVADFIKHHFRY